MTETKPKRRWLRFSLRTLFLLMTLAGCLFGWLGWNHHQVIQRKNALAYLKSINFGKIVRADNAPPWNADTIPLVRQWMGDEAISSITIYSNYFQIGDGRALANLFPEAVVTWINNTDDHPPKEVTFTK